MHHDYNQLMHPIYEFLGCLTPIAWLDTAAQHLDLLIQDHANCEKKAASTAMNLLFRYSFFEQLQIKLAQLIREEMLHYEQVLDLMQMRGQQWVGLSAGRYAGELRKQIRTYEPESLVDVLIIGAFVEARSCERFAALAQYFDAKQIEPDLARYYRYLLKSEARHFQDYLALAQQVVQHQPLKDPAEQITDRIEYFRTIEAQLINSPDPIFRFHSGVPIS